MPQKVLRFSGINRSVNEFQNSGACEELINLRPNASGGFRVVKEKEIYMKDADIKYFYEHSFGDTRNEIIVHVYGGVYWLKGGDKICIVETNSNNITLSHVNDVLVVYIEDENKQYAFKFKDTEYEKYYAAPIRLYASIDYRSDNSKVKQVSAAFDLNPMYDATERFDISQFEEYMGSVMSLFREIHRNGLCGVSVVGATYELEDGIEVWASAFVLANSQKSGIKDALKFSVVDRKNCIEARGPKDVHYLVHVTGEDKIEGVKKINVYASRPKSRYSFEFDGTVTEEGVTIQQASLVEVPLDELSLDGELMYYQGSIDPNHTTKGLHLNFSEKTLAGDVMPVTAGAIERIGPNIALNNRFHYFNSNVYHIIQTPSISEQLQERDTFSHWTCFVKFETGWRLVNRIYGMDVEKEQDFIYPMTGIKQLVFIKGHYIEGTGTFIQDYSDCFIVDMKDSSAYNYSHAFGVIPTVTVLSDKFLDELMNDDRSWEYAKKNGFAKQIFLRKETNAINVSLRQNPFAFSLKASYSFSGKIKDIVPSYIPISEVQISQFPVTVFTSNGIFALEQGDDDVLYETIDPQQPYIIDGKAKTTPLGSFFTSSGNLYLMSGRKVVDVSFPLDGKIDINLRGLDSYKTLCNNTVYLNDYLSNQDFSDFVTSSSLTYDQLHNELIIGSGDEAIPYSYVLNLDTKLYHKVPMRFLENSSSNRYSIVEQGGILNIVNMYDESSKDVPILLQSRPFQLETFHSHIQRLILLADADLSGDKQNLRLAVFGSDDLKNWKCIIASQKMNVALRQIRTNKSPKSYRDYVILITGTVSTDTDLADFIADYTVVNRRLG